MAEQKVHLWPVNHHSDIMTSLVVPTILPAVLANLVERQEAVPSCLDQSAGWPGSSVLTGGG